MQEPQSAVACGVSMFNRASSNAQQSYAKYTKGNRSNKSMVTTPIITPPFTHQRTDHGDYYSTNNRRRCWNRWFHRRVNPSIDNAADSFSLLTEKGFRCTKVRFVSTPNAKVRRVESLWVTWCKTACIYMCRSLGCWFWVRCLPFVFGLVSVENYKRIWTHMSVYLLDKVRIHFIVLIIDVSKIDPWLLCSKHICFRLWLCRVCFCGEVTSRWV